LAHSLITAKNPIATGSNLDGCPYLSAIVNSAKSAGRKGSDCSPLSKAVETSFSRHAPEKLANRFRMRYHEKREKVAQGTEGQRAKWSVKEGWNAKRF
jgi:hypothetical protein